MNRIGIVCDCHNTLINSNKAWINAFLDYIGYEYKLEISRYLYGKIKRRDIAKQYGIDFSLVETRANYYEKQNEKLISCLDVAKKMGIPIFIVSNAPSKRVLLDLEITGIRDLFIEIFTGDDGGKSNSNIFDLILEKYNLDFILFLGNEEFDDHIEHERVISFAITSFLRERFNFINGYTFDSNGKIFLENSDE